MLSYSHMTIWANQSWLALGLDLDGLWSRKFGMVLVMNPLLRVVVVVHPLEPWGAQGGQERRHDEEVSRLSPDQVSKLEEELLEGVIHHSETEGSSSSPHGHEWGRTCNGVGLIFWQRIFLSRYCSRSSLFDCSMHPAIAEGDQLRLSSVTFPEVSRVQSLAIMWVSVSSR